MHRVRNVGGWDRDLRIGLGIAALAFAALPRAGSGPRVGALAVAAIALGTGLSGYCPANQALGIDTWRVPLD
ncbi:YgaP family membrane protein [Ramlibacter rhizophilus]|uniref:DUF2892 domain-containing protein n=1 Tax=Ramlibacter rhizophilus TaxID=1781167 RepID=A0A4Z0C1Q1_9BURK|nr:DUF2892 domain-containing protein [Ramlibacter rhizophilus]TFZ04744.1 DUF2892 domain-containing protein [Ramlibacter rhizophilus]